MHVGAGIGFPSLVEGARTRRLSGSTPSARAQWNRLWLGDHGVAQTVAQAAGTDPAEGAAQAAAGAVTGRFTRPAEIADLVLMLASDRTGSVTGSDFAIDGGLVQAL